MKRAILAALVAALWAAPAYADYQPGFRRRSTPGRRCSAASRTRFRPSPRR